MANQLPDIGLDDRYFEQLSRLEENNFWFRSRNDVILWALSHFFSKAQNLLEVGCGTGFVLSAIERSFPEIALSGSELYGEDLAFAKERLNRANLVQVDARRVPFKGGFDVIGAFDVLEHIEEDQEVLSEIFGAVKPGGGIILTVPQPRWLWSFFDEVSCHKRRYSRIELIKKVESAGFHVLWSTFFFTLILPVMMISRLTRIKKETDNFRELDMLAEFRIPPMLDILFEKVCSLENGFRKRAISLPRGGSLLCVALKR